MSIKKIAAMTGTSASTVSRVLNNPDYKCSDPGMREKIWRAAMELNYTPNEAARNLKKGSRSQESRHYFIEILITRVDGIHADPYFEEQLRAVETQIHENACILSNVWYQPVFSDESKCSSPRTVRTLLAELKEESSGSADGLVIIGKCCASVLSELGKQYKNIVAINRNSSDGLIDEVTCDGRKIASLAVGHLLCLGHKKIGYVGKVRGESRYKGYCEMLHEHSAELYPEYILEIRQTEPEGYRAMQQILAMEDPPTGIYFANDITAIGALKCLSEHGSMLYHPSIISSDDIEEGQFSKPMLSTVHLPKESMARFAMMLLLDRIRGAHREVTRIEMSGKLMIRSSTGRAAETHQPEYFI